MPQNLNNEQQLTLKAYEAAIDFVSSLQVQPAYALREAFQQKYTFSRFRSDLVAGIIVGIVALPLSMALAIASGVSPQHGLYTAIVAGGLIALLGGSQTQVSGPTAAFVVILAPVATKFGMRGLLIATIMAGMILVGISLARMGKLIQYIPYPVTTGFTAGIAVVIATLQLKDFLGLSVPHMPDEYLERVAALVKAFPTARPEDLFIGALTLIILLVWPRINKRIPAPLVALIVGALTAFLLHKYAPGFTVATIGSRFSYVVNGVKQNGIPPLPPMPVLPWSFPGPEGSHLNSFWGVFHEIKELVPTAFAIAMLGAIESLLSAVVADGMAGTKHDPDAEIFAQGIGNMISPFFGGFAATGAIARTATNIRSGGRSPIASFVHALFLLICVLILAPLMGYLPMASLAALLLIVAWNMSEIKHFIHLLKVAPRSDVVVMMTCFSLTVVFDMVIGVTAGVVLAAFLFMHWMAKISHVKRTEDRHPELREPLPEGTVLYEIAGPLFFGAAQKAMSALSDIASNTRTVILHMSSVPVIDATGLFQFQSLLERLQKEKVYVIISGIQPQPATVFARAGIRKKERFLEICKKLHTAVQFAQVRADEYAEAAKAAKAVSLLRSISPDRITKSLNPEWLKSLSDWSTTGSLRSGKSKVPTGSLTTGSLKPDQSSSSVPAAPKTGSLQPERQTKPLSSEPPPKS